MAKASTNTATEHDLRRDATMDKVAGHELPKALFEYMLQADRLPHALLLCGPGQIGKTMFAWAAAKEIFWNYLPGKKDGEEGIERRNRLFARLSRENVHPDIFTLQPSGAMGQIRVDDAREFMDEHAHITPVEGGAKLLLVEGAETINESAANSMLKLLEEPPSYLRFLLITDFPHQMLTTIRSRCAILRFQPLGEEELLDWLRLKTGEENTELLSDVVRRAEGKPGKALELMADQAEASTVADAMRDFNNLGFSAVFKAATALSSVPGELDVVLGEMLVYYRDMLTVRMGHPDYLVDTRYLQAFEELNPKPSVAGLAAAMDVINDELDIGRRVGNTQVHLEALLCQIGKAMRAAG
jgi:DNA polymerase III delta prime subunit